MGVLVAFCIILFLPTVSHTEEGQKELLDWLEKTERFALFTECQPLNIRVFLNDSNSYDVEDNVARQVRLRNILVSRLRERQLYQQGGEGGLTLQVFIVGNDGMIALGYAKSFYDPLTVYTDEGITWIKFYVLEGTTDRILARRSLVLLNQFIDDYLHVNELACRDK